METWSLKHMSQYTGCSSSMHRALVGTICTPATSIPLKNNWKSSRNRIGRLPEIRFATPADIPLQDLYLVLTRTPRKFGICPLFKEPFSVAPR
jgi:hypothetical protein